MLRAIEHVLQAPLDERSLDLRTMPESQWFERKAFSTDAKTIAKTLIGFANAEGGYLVLGIRDRTFEDFDSFAKKINQIRQVPITHIAPPLQPDIRELEVMTEDGLASRVLVFAVPPSPTCHKRTDDRTFLRCGDFTLELSHAQWMELFYDRSPFTYEAETTHATLDDLDPELTQEFQQRIGHNGDLPSLLRTRGLLTPQGGLTVAATLLFAKDPQDFLPQSSLRLLRFITDEAEYGQRQTLAEGGDIRIDGPLPYQIRQAFKTLDEWLPRPHRLQPDGSFGASDTLIPRGVWQEAIVNAVAHRSYSQIGDHIRVSIFPSRIEVSSPGVFPGFVTTDTLQNPLTIDRYARNPRIARVLSDFGITQELGEGIRRMVHQMRSADLSDPTFSQHGQKVIVTLDAQTRLKPELLEQLPSRTSAIINVLRKSGAIGTGDLVEALGISRPALLRDLRTLQTHGIIERRGKSPKDPRATWHIVGSA